MGSPKDLGLPAGTVPRLQGKVAVITGAARGQGRSHAVRLATEGADLILLDSCTDAATAPYRGATAADLDGTAQAVTDLGRRAHVAVADVRDQAQLDTAIQAGVQALGRLDVVCANAGILSMAPVHLLSEEQWSEMVDINLSGVWRTIKAAIPHLIAGGGRASIIAISSAAALHGAPNIAHYVAAKSGVLGLVRSLAVELAPLGIRANAICSTNVDSPMIQNDAMYRLFVPGSEAPDREDFAMATSGTHPMGVPWIDPSDVSAVVAFLASDESRFMSGTQIPVMAGRPS